ncbi:hypothetical protein C8F04DRAFT_1314123 [Mycena alexandri]|uniref:Uncharacterized protein n=1 Tax=Mycena alexandri TaxID=1745969 RepID=A0AAD6T6Q4_9AGAR|nr:hypothetical protein C8F04DRAFT_1314123 [Mycena alexandri]
MPYSLTRSLHTDSGNASGGVQEEMRGAYSPPSLLFYCASRPRLPPSLEPAFTPPPPSFLPFARRPCPRIPFARTLRACTCVRAESPRKPSNLPIAPHRPHPHPPHLISRRPPPVYVHAAPAQALSAPVAVCAISHSAWTQLRMRVECPGAAPQVLLAYGSASRSPPAPPLLFSSLPPYPSSSPPTHHAPSLVPPPSYRRTPSAPDSHSARPVRGPAGVARAEFARTGSARTHFCVCARCTLPQIHTPRCLP